MRRIPSDSARPDIQVAQHAHLHMLGSLDVAVIHIGASVHCFVVVGNAGAGTTAIDASGKPSKMDAACANPCQCNGVPVEEIGTHGIADVRQRQVEVVVFIQRNGRADSFAAKVPWVRIVVGSASRRSAFAPPP